MPFFFILSLRQVGHLISIVICISLFYQNSICFFSAYFLIHHQLFKSTFNKQASVQQLATAIPKSKITLLLQGFFTNIANPKALVYFSSVFSLAINPDMPLTTQSSLLTLIWLESLIWFALVAYLFSWHKMNAAYQRLSQWIDGLTGGIFISFGCYLILNRD